jgi:hypothetical protein
LLLKGSIKHLNLETTRDLNLEGCRKGMGIKNVQPHGDFNLSLPDRDEELLSRGHRKAAGFSGKADA